MLNLAHVHLVLNHLPLLTLPIALVFFLFSSYKKNEEFKRFSLWVIIVTSLTVVPVFLTGEPAEEVIEHLPGISERLIKNHEEFAEVSFALTLLSSFIAFVLLLFSGRIIFLKKHGDKLVIISCLIALATLFYSANLGGRINHPEIKESSAIH